jgi:hypothetical protein
MSDCRNCAGEGWVCENHLDQPWEESGHAANCGAGAPCPVCRSDMANAGILGLLKEASETLQTYRDYISDTAQGLDLRPYKTMAAEDLARVDALIAKVSA